MEIIQPRTELEAVNTILRLVGQSPVNSLAVQDLAPGAIARDILRETNRSVQSEGWYFNRIRDKKIDPDSNGNLTLSVDVISIYPSRYYRWDENCYYILNNRVYDVNNSTDIFEKSLYFNLIVARDFSDLPQDFREYITMEAGSKYCASMGQSDLLVQFSDAELQLARTKLKKLELRNGDFYLGKGGGYFARAKRRTF